MLQQRLSSRQREISSSDMRIDRNILYKAVTIIMVVTVLVLSVYIMVNKLGLVEGYDFGGGAYYYVDIPEFEKIVNQDGKDSVMGSCGPFSVVGVAYVASLALD